MKSLLNYHAEIFINVIFINRSITPKRVSRAGSISAV